MKKKLFSEPAPYAVGVAMAFALLAPDTRAMKPNTVNANPLFGAADACADECEQAIDWICIHGSHKDYHYWDSGI